MIAYSEGEGAIFGDPIRRSETGVHKIEDLVRDRIALKADLSGYNALGVGGLVDSTDRDGRELSAVFSVEDDAVDAVREGTAVLSVDHDVSDGYLAHQRLAACLCIYDAREPIKVIFVIDFLGGFKDFSCIFQHNCATI